MEASAFQDSLDLQIAGVFNKRVTPPHAGRAGRGGDHAPGIII